MAIEPNQAIGSALPEETYTWDEADVMTYHLALGAGCEPTNTRELRYVNEHTLRPLPTFGMTIPTVFGVASPRLYASEPPEIRLPGIQLNLADLLHTSQDLYMHRPIPPRGTAHAYSQIIDVDDTGSAAVLKQQADIVYTDGASLFTSTSTIRIRGEGRGTRRGARNDSHRAPSEAPREVFDTPTLPQQALLYRMSGDRNPLHIDPEYAKAAGYPRPILQGSCVYGMICKEAVDRVFHSRPERVRHYSAHFRGVVYPGEMLRTRLWGDQKLVQLHTTVPARENAEVLSARLSAGKAE